MNIIVIMKQTFDTEDKIVIENGVVSEDGVKFVINPYDEYAIEEALKLKESLGGTVKVVSVGPARTAEALRTALAMGADEAILISDERISQDEHAISIILAAFLANQSFDLILGGNFSVDTGSGQVAVRLAELLQIPHISSITKLEVLGNKVAVQRDAEGDAELLEIALPALLTAQQGLNEPRYPTLPGIMKAKKKPFGQLSLDDVGLTQETIAAKTVRTELFLPSAKQPGQILKGTIEEQAAKLALLLHSESNVF